MPEPFYADESVTLHLGDCLDVLRTMEPDSVDAIVTDPPAGIAFMDREWDDFRRARNPADAGRDNVFGRTSARGPEYGRRDRGQFVDWLTERLDEAYRVLKPGGHALVWSIPRTSHWTAWAIEDAGFDIRDCIPHLFGSGFPKSLDVSKAIDKAAGAQREVVAIKASNRPNVVGFEPGGSMGGGAYTERLETAPATEDAARWEGWGTALKPGQEMWWLARKPIRGTVAANVLEFGTGALNIDGCRVAHASEADQRRNDVAEPGMRESRSMFGGGFRAATDPAGRWPANIVFTHSAACEVIGTQLVRGDSRSGQPRGRRPGGFGDIGADSGDETPNGTLHGDQETEVWACADDCPVGELDRQAPAAGSFLPPGRDYRAGQNKAVYAASTEHGTSAHDLPGGASRFYPTFKYQAKAPERERPRLEDGSAHETVKPLGLIIWLIKLITPPGGTVLDLFAGSGPVGEAAIIEGFRCVLIDQDPKSAELIKTRLSKPIQPVMFGFDEAS